MDIEPSDIHCAQGYNKRSPQSCTEMGCTAELHRCDSWYPLAGNSPRTHSAADSLRVGTRVAKKGCQEWVWASVHIILVRQSCYQRDGCYAPIGGIIRQLLARIKIRAHAGVGAVPRRVSQSCIRVQG